MQEWPPSRERLRDLARGDEFVEGVFAFAVFLDQHGFLRDKLDAFEIALWALEARTREEMDEMDTGDGGDAP